MPLADQHAGSRGFLFLRQPAGRRPALLPRPYSPRLPSHLARSAGLVVCLKFQTARHVHRHCERQRSNPCRGTNKEWIASSLSLLAMTTHTYLRNLLRYNGTTGNLRMTHMREWRVGPPQLASLAID